MVDAARNPDIILVWPAGRAAPAAKPVPGYSVRDLPVALDAWWIDIHRLAVPSFRRADLESWLERYRELALTDGILVATDDASGEPVATAGSLANSKGGMFPGGGQLGWVATVPSHRGRGLAHWLSSLATKRLLDDGFDRVFLCTGDDMLDAIRVYRRIGYIPCLYASDQRERWARICEATKGAFAPQHWPTPEEYLTG